MVGHRRRLRGRGRACAGRRAHPGVRVAGHLHRPGAGGAPGPAGARRVQDGRHPRRRRPPSADRTSDRRRRTWLANAGELLTFGALVGALFLGVLLLVVVWDYQPIAGAVVVSALPAASFAVRPLGHRLAPAVAGGAGAVVLAAGLAGLALLPASAGGWPRCRSRSAAPGWAWRSSVLGPASLPDGARPIAAASRSVAARTRASCSG